MKKDYEVNEVTGEPTNRQRCKWARKALDAYRKETDEDADDDTAIIDLIADLLHLAGTQKAADILQTAQGHYEEEELGL